MFDLAAVAVALLSTVVASASPVTPATAPLSRNDDSVVMELAERYAPHVVLQRQPVPCGDGEPFAPSDVGAILGQADVVLRSSTGEVLITAPTDRDLAAAPADSNIDLPGDAGRPGCDFEKRFGRVANSLPTTMYVRLAADPDRPDRIALQYWLYFIYNDWNNIHEGDWEMAQIVFDASTAEQALQTEPIGMAVSQHYGNERSPWADVTRLGDRPVIFAAVGSHAIYYSPHRWFGKSGDTGFGCDDTRGPSDQVDSRIVVMPDVVTPGDGFGWLTFSGRWGQRQASINDSETGPPSTEQWQHPITWMESTGRDAAVTVPELGGVTGFFCAASAAGSKVLNRLLDRPVVTGSILVALMLGVVLLLRRTRWSPVIMQPIATRRSVGQTVRSSWRLLMVNKHSFVPISVLLLAAGGIATLLQILVARVSAVRTFTDVVGRGGGGDAVLGFLIGTVITVPVTVVALGSAMVLTNNLETHDSGWSAIGKVWRSGVLLPLVVLTVTIFLGWIVLPLALFLVACWAVAPSAALVDGSPLGRSLNTSTGLTHGHRLRTLTTAVAAITIAFFTGPFLGTIVLLITNVSFSFVNIIAGIVSAILTPYLAVIIALYHGDLVARQGDAIKEPPLA